MEANFNDKELESGVYRIYNRLKDRSYYGSAKHFVDRYDSHVKLLKSDNHFNGFLQNDFNQCGIKYFMFEILEITFLEERKIIEQIYLDVYWDKQNKCYNLMKKIGVEPSTFSHNPEKTRKIQSERSKLRWEDPTYKENILSNIKQTMSTPEYKENFSNLMIEAWKDDDERRINTSLRFKNIWENNREVIYGRMHSQEAIDKRTDIRKIVTIEKHKKLILNKKSETKYDYNPPLTINGMKNSNKFKTFFNVNLLSPCGVLYKNITNIRNFCQENKLITSNINDLINIKIFFHKGWIKYFDLEKNYDLHEIQIDKNIKSTIEQQKRLKEVIGECIFVDIDNLFFKSPTGQIYNNITNIAQFAREHDLSRECLRDIKNGHQKSHKGWTLYNPIPTPI